MAREHDPWLAAEPTLGAAAAHLFARALRRPWRTVLLAAFSTALVVSSRVTRAPSYSATLFLRMSEGDVGVGGGAIARPPSEIRDYINNVALSTARLTELAKKHNLGGALMKKDPQMALASLKDRIEIQVARNYFLEERHADDAPRSAEVSITFPHGSAEVARAVVNDVGQTILDEQADRRSARLEQMRTFQAAQLAHHKDQIKGLQADLDLLSLESVGASKAQLLDIQARQAVARSRMQQALEQSELLQQRGTAVEFAQKIEEQRLGLTFEIVDESLETISPRRTLFQIGRMSAVIFVLALGLWFVIVGAFGSRVYRAEDLRRLDLPVLGTLSRFAGDDVGSFRDRTRRERKMRV